ncbi:MAG: SDR family NAD(P)-dependent oxidoreductase [Rhodospirillales bacterium]|nr:SDR family NAD(P)-dependent oxidoreductase [Rhodospirillales bacterium]
MMGGRLEGRTALITGGGRGIGEGIARVFAREGARILIATRTVRRGEKVAREIEKAGGTASACPRTSRMPPSVSPATRRAPSPARLSSLTAVRSCPRAKQGRSRVDRTRLEPQAVPTGCENPL